ncbi:MAG: four-carbon acid sugar kinase family protein [Hyphomicrobiales bacterium]|nr:four-carbon acid sugar kinase family protein [Hyphomicrobiales bacterium]MBV9054731.1 four-carbon acid sugar kinase family protein [Hyphomicrobiales bacterium]
MLLGCIADDFTGASDLANTLAKGGMSTIQFVGVPKGTAQARCEAGVVALKTRSIAAADAVAQSLTALRWLETQGCRQFLFKYCSTFDSTPRGNIGPVAEALLQALPASVAVVCPVFPATGRTLFMGHLFVKDRLLSESGMENHPLNPMTDPDLRRWLRLQTKGEVGFVPHSIVRQGGEAVRAALDAEAKAGRRLVVVDAIEDADLLAIGAAVADQPLVTGGSGIALGLPENFRKAGMLSNAGSTYKPGKGPGIVLSGSCSSASQAQLAHYLLTHPGLALDPDALMAGSQKVTDAALFVRDHLDDAPAVYSTASPAKVAKSQEKFGRQELAEKIEHFFGALAAALVDEGVARIAVGGGETSGAVVTALKTESLIVGPEIDPGVPALAASGDRRVHLALKSGNFGALDFYDKALHALGEA